MTADDSTGIGCALRKPSKNREVLVQQGVPTDLVGEILKLLGSRQLTVDQQVADLDERRPLGELIDGDAAVPQDTGVPVDG